MRLKRHAARPLCGLAAFLATIPLVFCPALAAAAPGPADALRQLQRRQDQILQQQEEQRRLQEESLRRQREAPPQGRAPGPLPQEPVRPDAACVDVRRVEIAGSTLLSPSLLASIAASYENKCLSLAEITNLLRAISNAYIERGYVTTRAFVDPNQREDGVLRILVVEGRVEKIILNGGDRNSRYQAVSAFPGLEGKPLNLRDIEQGLDQMNRLPSSDAAMELVPGEEVGGTIVRVTNAPARTWRLGAGSDNSGQRSTGQGMYNLSFEKDNFMGIGDQLAVYWSADAPVVDEKLHAGRQEGHNHSFSMYFSIPWGYWTFSGNVSRFAYDTYIYGFNTEYRLSGVSTASTAQAERVIHRDANSKTSLFVNLNTYDVEAEIEGARLDSSSYMLAGVGAGLSHSRRMLGGVLSASLSYNRGMPWFGATRRKWDGPDVPRGEYGKYAASLSWYRPFKALKQDFHWHLSARGQLAPQTLYGSERIQIGGRNTVRGYHEDSVSGDTGAYVRNELGWHLPLPRAAQSNLLRGVQIYGAWDYGWIRPDRIDPYERGVMTGVAVGARTQGDVSLDVAIARPLRHPDFIEERNYEIYASLNVTF